MCKEKIQRLIKKLKVVFGGRYIKIQENINIEVNFPGNSGLQIILKLKTVFGGKGQIQTTTEIQTEISETTKPKSCSIFNYEMKRLIH
jgi:hypothetical protein